MATEAVDFATFLARSGIKPAAVAQETGLYRSTITRIRDGAEPTFANMQLLSEWADRARRRGKLDVRLSWDYLLAADRPPRPPRPRRRRSNGVRRTDADRPSAA